MSAALTAAQLGRACLPNLTCFHEVDKSGHFAAWEQPELFSEELRAAFRPCASRSRGRASVTTCRRRHHPFTDAVVEADSY